MRCAMSGQERDGDAVVFEDSYGCRGVAPWCRGVDCRNGFITIELLKTSSTDYGYVDWSLRGGQWETWEVEGFWGGGGGWTYLLRRWLGGLSLS